LTITIEAKEGSGTPGGYGFQMVVLENAGNTNAGTLSRNTPSATTHILPCDDANIPDRCQSGRIFFEHEYADQAATAASGANETRFWSVDWTAPPAGTGAVTIYAISNVVNADGSRNGDSPAATNKTKVLTEAAAAISFTANGPFSIDENSANGTLVGDVDASSGGGSSDDGLTYSITGGSGASVFAIDSASGEISVANSGALDFESSDSFEVSVQADSGSSQVSVTVTINVNNLNDNSPVFTASGPFTVLETATNGSIAGNLNSNDGDLGGNDAGISYSVLGGSGVGVFAISASGGIITVLDASQLTGSSLTLDVQADDGVFQTTTTVTINIGIGGGDFAINQGIAASWTNSQTLGQGFLIDIEPVSQFMFVAWFTFEEAAGKVGSSDNRWLVAAGNYAAGVANLQLFRVSGGAFNDPQTVEQVPNGTLDITFSDCQNGVVEYDLPSDQLSGQIEIVRAVPGTEALCQSIIAAQKQHLDEVVAGLKSDSPWLDADETPVEVQSVEEQIQPAGSFEINQGISASWFNSNTPGQGFLFDVDPITQFIFIAWFTFEDANGNKLGAAEQRWLVASGNYSGNIADLALFSISGGLFDDPQGVTATESGSITLAFSDCENGIVEYDIPGDGLSGQIAIVRALPGTEQLCNTLATSKQEN
jgi:hypothetical protein